MQPTPAEPANTQPTPAPDGPTAGAPLVPPPPRHAQWVLMAAAAGSFALFWWAGKWLGVPAHPGYEGSLLRQPTAGGTATAVAAAAVLYLGVAAVVTLLARRQWVYTGLLAASAGLAAWSFRGGPVRFVLLAPDNAGVGAGAFYTLAAETLILGLIVGIGWLVVLPRVAGDATADEPLIPRPPPGTLQAVLSQAAFVAVGVLLLVPNGEKKQAAFGVLVACFIATAVAQHFYHDERVARWFWAGPVIVGVVGYLVNAFGPDATLAVETGRLTGTFGALARPLPLDYAGAGMVGVLMGYWIGSEHPETAKAYLIGGVVHGLKTSRRVADAREPQTGTKEV